MSFGLPVSPSSKMKPVTSPTEWVLRGERTVNPAWRNSAIFNSMASKDRRKLPEMVHVRYCKVTSWSEANELLGLVELLPQPLITECDSLRARLQNCGQRMLVNRILRENILDEGVDGQLPFRVCELIYYIVIILLDKLVERACVVIGFLGREVFGRQTVAEHPSLLGQRRRRDQHHHVEASARARNRGIELIQEVRGNDEDHTLSAPKLLNQA